MKIFFSVGEPSGDVHGAKLINHLRSLRPDIECAGYGGPQMKRAGFDVHFEMTQLAVMFFLKVIFKIPKFWKLYRQAIAYFRNHDVAAVVLIDFPGFNWWIAKAAKRQGIPVFYYGVPQMWAWAPWRVKKIQRYVDHVLCQLPFEKKWYADRGCSANFVGHPYFDELHEYVGDKSFVEKYSDPGTRLLTLLPGSRTAEVHDHLNWLLDAADRVSKSVPRLAVAVACYDQRHADFVSAEIAARGAAIDVFVGRTPELIEMSDCCIACSGSVSLQLMFYRTPSVIIYKLNRFRMLLLWSLVRSRYITLVNLFWAPDISRNGRKRFDPDAPGAAQVPMPEYLSTTDRPAQVAAHISRWMLDDEQLSQRVNQLDELANRYARKGSAERTAVYILSQLESGQNRQKAA